MNKEQCLQKKRFEQNNFSSYMFIRYCFLLNYILSYQNVFDESKRK